MESNYKDGPSATPAEGPQQVTDSGEDASTVLVGVRESACRFLLSATPHIEARSLATTVTSLLRFLQLCALRALRPDIAVFWRSASPVCFSLTMA
jgi:hypothetical protein